jgi:acetyl-CoA synthetase
VLSGIAAHTHLTTAQHLAWTERAKSDPSGFWADQAKRINWMREPTRIRNASFLGDVNIKWYEDGTLNASATCLDRHLVERPDQAAIIWEGDDPDNQKTVTYRELHDQVCRLANAMRGLGVRRGDRVTIYLPMVIEAAVAMLACARLGAIHAVVFGGFSPDSLANRIQDCASTLLITADEGRRGGRKVALKANADLALKTCPTIRHVIVVPVTGTDVPMQAGRDLGYTALLADVRPDCKPEEMGAENPLFILYTSGSTGKPKGVVHTTGGYMVWAAMTHQLVFDYQPGEVYWCTADVGWVTGHTYIVYGPLANGATTLMFEGIPNYPDSRRVWQVVDKHQVNIFYTAPTAIRALMRDGEGPVKSTSRASLRILGRVGEPINPEAWNWYHRVVGEGRCSIVDTWWQTETGGILISPLPGAEPLKPGSATLPLPGILPVLEDGEGKLLEGAAEGNLCIAES